MERADLCVSGLDPIMYEELFSVRECFSLNPAVIPIPVTLLFLLEGIELHFSISFFFFFKNNFASVT